MTDTVTVTLDAATVPAVPALNVVLEASDDFAPRTRKTTSDTLVALKPSLDAVKLAPGKVYTVARDLTATKAAGMVGLLNEHYPSEWTFVGRTSPTGGSVVQAKYDPANLRPVRKVTRKAAGQPGKTAGSKPAK